MQSLSLEGILLKQLHIKHWGQPPHIPSKHCMRALTVIHRVLTALYFFNHKIDAGKVFFNTLICSYQVCCRLNVIELLSDMLTNKSGSGIAVSKQTDCQCISIMWNGKPSFLLICNTCTYEALCAEQNYPFEAMTLCGNCICHAARHFHVLPLSSEDFTLAPYMIMKVVRSSSRSRQWPQKARSPLATLPTGNISQLTVAQLILRNLSQYCQFEQLPSSMSRMLRLIFTLMHARVRLPLCESVLLAEISNYYPERTPPPTPLPRQHKMACKFAMCTHTWCTVRLTCYLHEALNLT